MNTRLAFPMFALVLLSALIVAFSAVAQAQMAPQTMISSITTVTQPASHLPQDRTVHLTKAKTIQNQHNKKGSESFPTATANG